MDVFASVFWGGKHQKAFSDVKVFNTNINAPYYKYPLFINAFNVRNNRSTHEQCIREIEMGSL